MAHSLGQPQSGRVSNRCAYVNALKIVLQPPASSSVTSALRDYCTFRGNQVCSIIWLAAQHVRRSGGGSVTGSVSNAYILMPPRPPGRQRAASVAAQLLSASRYWILGSETPGDSPSLGTAIDEF